MQNREKINDNVYEVELPGNFDISPVFNVSDLYSFHGDGAERDDVDEVVDWQQQVPVKKKEEVDQILDKKTMDTRHGKYNKYLVHWKGLEQEDNTWVTEWEIQKLDADKWKQFEEDNLQELRFFQAGENDAPELAGNLTRS